MTLIRANPSHPCHPWPILFLLLLFSPAAAQTSWKAGVAKVAITPDAPVWMAGYASRTRPSEGKVQDLYAKALALDDGRGGRVVLLTSDLIGFSGALAEAIGARVEKQFRLPRARLVLSASHTHTGPVTRDYLRGSYELDARQAAAVADYNRRLEDQIVAVIGRALGDLRPARLDFGRGETHFGVNRREFTGQGVRIGVNRDGPVDPDVPVLRVASPRGELRAVVFGYACHNTTLTGEFYEFSGDYAGFAQERLEAAHPGATAMYVMGCGADINPQPRSQLELARDHGAALAAAVGGVLGGALAPVRGPLRADFERVALPFAAPPARAEFEARLTEANAFRRRHAERMLARLDRDGKLISEYSYPIQVVRFGGDLTLVALAGEVVVDYVLRLKRELGAGGLWVAAYCNDVFAYVPSARVLKEGGYEAAESMIYYDLPGPFAPAVEELIVGRVRALAGKK